MPFHSHGGGPQRLKSWLAPQLPQHPQVLAPLSAWALGLPVLSLFLSTGFLRGVFVGVSASLYLESFLFLPFIPLTEFLEYISLYLFFQNLKLFASHNHPPSTSAQGPPCTSLASMTAVERPAWCLTWGSWRGQRTLSSSLCLKHRRTSGLTLS